MQNNLEKHPLMSLWNKKRLFMFSPYHSKEKKTALLIIFCHRVTSSQPDAYIRSIFWSEEAVGFSYPLSPNCVKLSSWSVKTLLTQATRCKSEIRANLGEISEQSCFTRYVLQWNSLFIFISLMTQFFLSHQPRHWCFSCYLTMQLEQEEAMDLLSGLTLWDTESTTGT